MDDGFGGNGRWVFDRSGQRKLRFCVGTADDIEFRCRFGARVVLVSGRHEISILDAEAIPESQQITSRSSHLTRSSLSLKPPPSPRPPFARRRRRRRRQQWAEEKSKFSPSP